jgi:hypothetical protein
MVASSAKISRPRLPDVCATRRPRTFVRKASMSVRFELVAGSCERPLGTGALSGVFAIANSHLLFVI